MIAGGSQACHQIWPYGSETSSTDRADLADSAVDATLLPDANVSVDTTPPDASVPGDAPSPLCINWSDFSPPTLVSSISDAIDDDWRASATADGLTLVVGSWRSGTVGREDLWIAERATPDSDFGTPQNIAGLNTTGDDSGPWISADGLTLHFVSNRPGAWQIYRATRASRSAPFGAATRLAEFDATTNHFTPYVSVDGQALCYSSWDAIWCSWSVTNGSFDPPVKMTSLDSSGNDLLGSFSSDGLEAVISSDRSGGHGGFDLYLARRAKVGDPFGPPANLGAAINTPNDDVGGSLSPYGETLYLTRGANALSGGYADIWVSTRTCLD